MAYLMAGQPDELDRLQLQSRVWEPAGQRLLDELGLGQGKRVLDVGCGCLGWLRIFSRWVGPAGSCVGTDVDHAMLAAAGRLVETEGLANVELAYDDLFESQLEPGSFDVVHARFQLAPLGRFAEQLDAYRRLLTPGGVLVLEDPDTASWRYHPAAPGLTQLIVKIKEAFRVGGGDFDAGCHEYQLLADAGFEPDIRAEIVALPPGHPYLGLPSQFAKSLRPRLLAGTGEQELDDWIARAEGELTSARLWGLTFTLMQTWATAGG